MSRSRQSLDRYVPPVHVAQMPLGTSIPLHHHDEGQLVCPADGIVGITAATGSWIINPDQAVWLPAGFAHASRAYSCGRLCTILLPAVETTGLPMDPRVISVTPLLRQMVLSLTSTGGMPGPEARTHMLAIVASTIRIAPPPPCRLFLPMHGDARLRRITERLGADPSDDATLAELGAEAGLSERTLSRLFHEQLGMGFRQWRTELRIHMAMALLAEGEEISSAGYQCGWANPSSFVAAFRASIGMTPGRFRTKLENRRREAAELSPGRSPRAAVSGSQSVRPAPVRRSKASR